MQAGPARKTGKVKWFNEIKGSGIIRGPEGRDYTVHFSEILDEGFRTLFEGEIVEFEAVPAPGGAAAERVRRVNPECGRMPAVEK